MSTCRNRHVLDLVSGNDSMPSPRLQVFVSLESSGFQLITIGRFCQAEKTVFSIPILLRSPLIISHQTPAVDWFAATRSCGQTTRAKRTCEQIGCTGHRCIITLGLPTIKTTISFERNFWLEMPKYSGKLRIVKQPSVYLSPEAGSNTLFEEQQFTKLVV